MKSGQNFRTSAGLGDTEDERNGDDGDGQDETIHEANE